MSTQKSVFLINEHEILASLESAFDPSHQNDLLNRVYLTLSGLEIRKGILLRVQSSFNLSGALNISQATSS